ncbi:hypothetical protein CBL_12828 [Carabus blaptoides fortunei]
MANFDEIVHLGAAAAVEELEIMAQNQRIFHVRDDDFSLSDKKIVRIFRVNQNMANELTDRLEECMPPRSRLSALDTTVEVLTALKFFACGSYQMDEIMNEWVTFPRDINQLESLRTE